MPGAHKGLTVHSCGLMILRQVLTWAFYHWPLNSAISHGRQAGARPGVTGTQPPPYGGPTPALRGAGDGGRVETRAWSPTPRLGPTSSVGPFLPQSSREAPLRV